MNKNIAIACIALVSYLNLLTQVRGDEVPSTKEKDRFDLVDWTDIKTHSKWVGKRIAVDGYLSFTGTGDFPTIFLWDTEEALKRKRSYHYIRLDSKSASTLIAKKFGSGADNWRVLDGMFVTITGTFEVQAEGKKYIDLGTVTKVSRIDIMNNGLVLLRIE